MKKLLLSGLLYFAFGLLTAQEYQFYALSTDKNNNKPVYLCELDSISGSISIIEDYSGVYKGNYLAVSLDNKQLLATSFNTGEDKGGLVQYNISDDGKLTYSHAQFKTGGIPCYVSFTPDSNYVLSAYYKDDKIALSRFTDNQLSSEIDEIVEPDNSKGHFIRTDPSGKFVHAVFLGLDKVFNYTIEDDKFVANTNQEYFSLPEGYGPRHFVFHPDSNWIYILSETHGSITACDYDPQTGVISDFQDISMLPASYTDKNIAAAIRIHPNGKYLYASNRGHNSIVAYEIGSDGRLSLIEYETSGINYPRDFNISSDGCFMLVGNQKGNSIFSYRIDESTGELNYTGKQLSIPAPLSIVFYPAYSKNTLVDTTTADTTTIDTSNTTAILPWDSGLDISTICYPNPAKNLIYLNSPDQSNLEKVEIFDISGHLVKYLVRWNLSIIDISELPRGIYFVVVNTEMRKYNVKIILS